MWSTNSYQNKHFDLQQNTAIISQTQKNKEFKQHNSFWPNKLTQIPNPNLQYHAKMTKELLLVQLGFVENKMFSYCGGVRVGSDELIRTIRRKYLFSDPFFIWLFICIKFFIKSYRIWLCQKTLGLTLISVTNG